MRRIGVRAAAAALVLGMLATSPASAAIRKFDLRDGDRRFGRTTGTIEWDNHDIEIIGALLAGGKGASLWLKWEALGHTYNRQVQRAGPSRTAKFNRRFSFPGGPSSITLTLCDDNPGGGCGEQRIF
jgi:hypothetical protein